MTDFQRSEELRQGATRAWAALDNRSRLQKALRARHRTPQTFTDGQLVFVWRHNKVGGGQWKGPGIVIIATTGGCWVNMRGALWRCSNEQMRAATNDESLGAEMVNRYLDDLRWDVQRNRGPKKYVDVTREGAPHFPGDPAPDGAEDIPAGDNSDDEMPEPEPALEPISRQTSASDQPMSEPPRSDVSRDAPASQREVDARADTRERSRSPPAPSQRFPYPFDRVPTVNYNCYEEIDVNFENYVSFFVQEAMAEFDDSRNYFTVKKKPVDAEIRVDHLPPQAQDLFLLPDGSRGKEWMNMINQTKSEGGPAVIVHRGARARELSRQFSHRTIPSRWLDRWKDMGDDFDLGLPPTLLHEAGIPLHHGPKSRWILQGFHDPDIALLQRSVPTPETMDVPVCLQMLASIFAKVWVGDVKGAFSQGLRNQRPEPLFATPPPGGIPGETDDILIEICAEIYGLISGPPGWRKSLF